MKRKLTYLLLFFSWTTLAQTGKEKVDSYPGSSNQILNLTADSDKAIHDLNDFLYLSDYQEIKTAGLEQVRLKGWSTWKTSSPDPTIKDVLWLKVVLNNKKKEDHPAILYLHDLQRVEIYETGDSLPLHHNTPAEIRDTIRTGTLLPFSERQTVKGLVLEGAGNSAQAKLRLPPGFTTLYLKAEFDFETPFKPQIKLYSEESWEGEVLKERDVFILLQGILLGALLILSIYHFLIFLQKKDRAFLWYSLYTSFTALTLMLELGVVQVYLFPERPFRLRILRESLAPHMMVAILYFLFMKTFIELKELLPRLDKILRWYFWMLIPSASILIVIYFITANADLLKIGHLYPISILIMGAIYIVAMARTRDALALYFVAGSLFLILGVLVNTLFFHLISSGIIDRTAFPRNYLTEIGAVVEILVFSLGLGYRLRLLEKQKQHIEEIDQAKSRFFANISHEFRTPLTVIMGYAAQIKGNKKEKIMIERNSHDLLELVNQLLDLAKLETQSLKLREVQADLVSYLQYLTESFHSLAEEKDVQLTFYPETRQLVMDFDEEKIKRIVNNLLSNAIKFTPAGGKVVLHAQEIKKKGQDWLQIKVNDTGPGIPEQELARIFDRFYQAKDEKVQNTGGSGVGLALTKELVELMKGRVSVSSKLGVGSEFQVLLPVKREAPIVKMGTEALPDYLKTNAALSDTPSLKPPLKAAAPTLLIVEDNPGVAAYIESLLKKDYHIMTARDGQSGVEMAKENVPDLIISDVMMPKKNGYEVCQELKNDERTSHIPIILLTAKASSEDKVEGLKGGADAYLTKPFNQEELAVRIQKMIELRQKLQARYSDAKLTKLKMQKKAESLEDVFLQKLVEVVEKRLDDPSLGVVDLCRAANLSNMQVNRKLKALTGETPSRFIRSIRLEKAMELLQTSDLNVSEVAYDVGFKDPAYFSRAFSEKFGQAPNSIRW